MQEKHPQYIDTGSIDQWISGAIGENPNALTRVPAVAEEAFNRVLRQTRQAMGTLVEYKELMMRYNCALKEIRTKFEVLNTEFKVRHERNPINGIQTRLKRTSSIAQKLARLGLPFDLKTIQEELDDVAGVRIICSYIDDIYTLADALLRQDDVTLVEKKDYIQSPKPNGYRSLHLIVRVPVFFADHKMDMKVEVQIRTIAMDFWASLEHQLKYKQEIPRQEEIVARLKACADIINSTDEEMLRIRQEIGQMTNAPTEEDILLEKLSRMDLPLE